MSNDSEKPTTTKTAKVYVWKEDGEKLSWKVGSLIGTVTVINYESSTFDDAWQWLHTNYIRETP